MSTQRVFSIARDFSRYPAGRFRTDGPWSGEKFREDYLLALVKKQGKVIVDLDGTAGYGSSFLEEAFGGAVRALKVSKASAREIIQIRSGDDSLVEEVHQYMDHAATDA